VFLSGSLKMKFPNGKEQKPIWKTAIPKRKNCHQSARHRNSKTTDQRCVDENSGPRFLYRMWQGRLPLVQFCKRQPVASGAARFGRRGLI
jgi:hypothetical protein